MQRIEMTVYFDVSQEPSEADLALLKDWLLDGIYRAKKGGSISNLLIEGYGIKQDEEK